MRKVAAFAFAAAAAVVAILFVSPGATGQPITGGGGGLTRVVHDTSMAGSGSTAAPLGIRKDCSTGQVLQWGGTDWGCAAAGGGITNSAGTNVVTKSNGTNVVASSITDDGTTVSTGESVSLGDASTDMVTITGRVTQNAANGPTSPHASYLLNVTGSNYSGADGGFQVFQSTGYDTTAGASQSLAGYFGNTSFQQTGSNGHTNYGVLAGASGGTSNYSFFGFAGTIRNDGAAIFGDTTLGALLGTGLVTLNNSTAGNSIAWSGASSAINLSGASASIKATSLRSYGNTQIDGETIFGASATDVFLYPPAANAGGTRHDINLNASGTGGIVRINSNTGGLALAGTGGFAVFGGANDGTANFSVDGTGNVTGVANLTIDGNSTLGNATSDTLTIAGSASVGTDISVSKTLALNERMTSKSAAPTISACGTSPTASLGGNHSATVTVGTGTITSCTITFGVTLTSPTCVVSTPDKNVRSDYTYAVTGTTLTITTSSGTFNMAGVNFDYSCQGH